MNKLEKGLILIGALCSLGGAGSFIYDVVKKKPSLRTDALITASSVFLLGGLGKTIYNKSFGKITYSQKKIEEDSDLYKKYFENKK